MEAPRAVPAGQTAPFALYVYDSTPDPTTARKLPLGMGWSSLPMPWTETSPSLVGLWNNTGVASLGNTTLRSRPAPSVVLRRPQGLNREVTFYLQGLIYDPGSAAARPASVTNGIEVVVLPSP